MKNRKEHWKGWLIGYAVAVVIIAFLVNAKDIDKILSTKAQAEVISPLPKAEKVVEITPTSTPEPIKASDNPYNPKSPKGIAWEINRIKFGVEHWKSWEILGTKESGWNPYAINRTSGACGIPQSLPCSKMDCERWDYECQINWMAQYIERRYGNPTKALAFHQERNWY